MSDPWFPDTTGDGWDGGAWSPDGGGPGGGGDPVGPDTTGGVDGGIGGDGIIGGGPGDGGGGLVGPTGPGVAPPGPPAPPAGPAPTPIGNRDAFARIKEILERYGLSSLTQWVWDQLVEGRSEVEIVQGLRDRPEYAARFPGMGIREKNKLPPISPGEYISWENRATSMMREAGFPRGFWDAPEDFANLIGMNVSIEQLAGRIKGGFSKVASAAPEVRAAFAEFFGADGDVALAAFFLDPNKAQPFLEQAVTSAEVGGVGRRFGFRFGRERALQLAQVGVDSESATRGFTTLAERMPLFDESFFERLDYTPEGIGIDATFGLSGTAAKDIDARLAERRARFGGGGQALMNSSGITGLGRGT